MWVITNRCFSIGRINPLSLWIVFSLYALTAQVAAAEPDSSSVTTPDSYAISAPVADLPKAEASQGPVQLHPRPRLRPKGVSETGPAPADPALQNKHFAASKITPKSGFSGIGFSGYLPPDPDMAVGPLHIVQVVNSQFAVFSKSGTMAAGYPKSLSSLWTPLGGGCATNNGGDPSIQYDRQADRWIITQLGSLKAPYSECIAVSTSGNPSGTYALYAYSFGTDLNDYPKFSVWPTAAADYSGSAYLATYNLFANGSSGKGAALCAYDRQAMLVGDAGAQQICQTRLNEYSYLPSDLDGNNPPAAEGTDTPAYFVTDNSSNALLIQKATWTFGATPSLSLTPSNLAVASFSEACGGGTCIPQASTTRKLDSLGDRPMYRLAYRNFDSTQSMVFNRSVTAGASVGIRWYELENSGSGFSVKQQSTFAPDANYRWMGSMAIDKDGNIALGYSTSSSTLFPSLRAAGRSPADPAGQLQSEQILQVGGGSQTGYSRWGDYSSMRVDPSDDSTFWYTGEYYQASSSYTWSTYIGSFRLAPVSPDFSLSASPSLVTFPEMKSGSNTSAISVAAQGAFTSDVSLTLGGCTSPNPFSWNLAPLTVTPGGTSTLTVNSSGVVQNSPASCTLTGTEIGGSKTHTVNVSARTLPDFTVSASTPSLTIKRGSKGSLTISVPKVATASSVQLSISGLPSGVNASFSPSTVSNGSSATSTLTINVKRNAQPATRTLTVTGNNGNFSHSTSFSLTISN